MRNTTGVQWAAICGAIGLLVLQIIGGLEYTEGGSLYARSSMVAAMITLAFLPVFIEVARQAKAYGIALALAVAFCAFLAFSLPATVGRTNEVREVKAAEAQQSSFSIRLIEGELAKAQSRLNEAYIEVGRECKTGFGAKCEGWRNSVVERQFRVDAIQKELMAAKPKMGDMGSEAWASVAGIGAATVRQLSSLSFGLGLDVVIWALMWFATSEKVRGVRPGSLVAENQPVMAIDAPKQVELPRVEVFPIAGNNPPSDPRPRKRTTKRQAKREKGVNWARRYRERFGKAPPLEVMSNVLRVPQTTAFRWRKLAA
jgi:hypothetical protein